MAKSSSPLSEALLLICLPLHTLHRGAAPRLFLFSSPHD